MTASNTDTCSNTDTRPNTERYHHTQTGPWHFIVFSIGVLQAYLAVALRNEPPLNLIFGVCAALMLVLGFSIRSLTIEEVGDGLSVRFGPLPLFKKKILFSDIESAKVSHTTLLDGFGIHYSLRGGWVWNIWGYPCVHLKLKKGQIWLGSNEPEKLLSAIQRKVD